MTYLYLTFDAIRQFVSLRQFQSSEFQESVTLCNILKGKSDNWNHSKHTTIQFHEDDKNGCIFFTHNLDRDRERGVLFDLDTFDAFNTNSDDKIITIFQKVLKYAIKYYNKYPLTRCERSLNANTTIVYPFAFTATRDSYKILIDKNSSKVSRKGKDILTIFYSGTTESDNLSFTNLRKALDHIASIDIKLIGSQEQQESNHNGVTAVTDLEKMDLTIDSRIGFDNWGCYLTDKQKEFISSPVEGPERLEGAAGTGKTLTMILRCINILKPKIEAKEKFQIVFITHSLSSKEHVIEIFKNNYPEIEEHLSTRDEIKYLLVITLQEWCIKYLGAYIAETEYLDKDAKDSKILQSLYIEEALSIVLKEDWDSYKLICSSKLVDFIEKTNRESLVEMLQFEIAILIKGRANGEFDKYKKITRPQYSIPCEEGAYDLNFLYLIFQKYQDSLESIGQYDSDDIILTALGQLNTPIWRRRRNQEGFQACFIDETQLFNLNELCIFHYLNSEKAKNNIVFAIDKAQAIGERGVQDAIMDEALGITSEAQESHKYNTIFRSSPDIIGLAFNILSSGATFFVNLENPLDSSIVNFTAEEERKCSPPLYLQCSNDEEIIKLAFQEAEKYPRECGVRKSKVLIAATSDHLLDLIETFSTKNHKPVEVLKSRGDSSTITKAFNNNRFVLGGIDYIGGLEFDKVIIIGVDKGRVPSTSHEEVGESFHFSNYAWHNRMYVAITRAKYSLVLIGDKSRGVAPILESAIFYELIEVKDNNN